MATVPHDASAEERGLDGLHVAGLLFAFLAALFMTGIMAAASMAQRYDLTSGAISDLGTLPETGWLFNGALVAVGVLNIIAAGLVFRQRRSLIGLGIAVLAGLGAIGAGLVPLDRGGLHGLFALVAFLFFNLQTLSDALWTRGVLMRATGLALAALGLAYVVVMVIGDAGHPAIFGAIGHGGAERMIVYPPMIWLMVYGGYLMGQPPAKQFR